MSGLGRLTLGETKFIGMVLEGLCYGLYSALFCMYMQYHASKELEIDKKNILLYALCILYILSTATVVLDVTRNVTGLHLTPNSPLVQLLHLLQVSITLTGLCDFISQIILIYRCWVIWGRKIRVIIIPSILALAFLAIWLATNGSAYIESVEPFSYFTNWGKILIPTSLGISLVVNAVVTSLIVLKISKLYWKVWPTSEDRNLGVGGANGKLRSIIFIITESGMALFSIQLVRVILGVFNLDSLYFIVGTHQMFNGLIPTIIFVRISMRMSFYDEESMAETAASWQFVSYNRNRIPEPRDVEIAEQDRLGPINIQQSDDIEIVDG